MLQERIRRFRKKYFANPRFASSQEEIKQLQESLLAESTSDNSFMALVVGSCIIATLGLLANSTAVIIGAMLIAPLMLPIRGLALGILAADRPLIRTSTQAIWVGTLLAIAMATLIGRTVNLSDYDSEVWARTQPNLLDLGIAITAGALAGFAKIKDKISSSLAGTAIAVALMPPLCVVGLWLAKANFQVALGALLLYTTNLLGITLACMVVFLWAGCSPLDRARHPLGWTLALTSLLVIPLGYTSYELIRQDRLEAKLREALLDRTLTFQRLSLVSMETDWLEKPPVVTLTVYANSPVTPVQVDLLEDFVAKEMGRPFRLVFQVSQFDEVTSQSFDSSPNSPFPKPSPPWQEN